MKKTLLLITALSFITSCVDNKYGFDNTPEDTVIGDEVVLPLGTTGSIFLNELIDIESVTEIKVDENGGYRFVYENIFTIESINPAVSDVSFGNSNPIVTAGLPPLLNITQPLKIPLTDTDNELAFSDIGEIKRIDSITLIKGVTDIDISVNFTGIKIINAIGEVIIEISLPKDSEMALNDKVSIGDDGIYTYTTSFDFNKIGIEKQNFSIGLNKIAPGKVNIKTYLDIQSAEKITFENITSISTHISIMDIAFDVLYGDFTLTKNIDESFITTDDITKLFGEDAVLDFYNPMINISTTHNSGIALNIDLDFVGYNKTEENTKLSTSLLIPSATVVGESVTASYVLSPLNPSIENVEWREFALNDILANNPYRVGVSGVANSVDSESMFIPSQVQIEASYDAVIPFATGSDFRISIEENFKDIFTPEIADVIFKTGSLEFFGTVSNTLPLNLTLVVKALDVNGNDLGVNFSTTNVSGSPDNSEVSTEIKLTVSESDMSKMYNARSLSLTFHASSDDNLAGSVIKEDNYIDITLKLRKLGGIVLN